MQASNETYQLEKASQKRGMLSRWLTPNFDVPASTPTPLIMSSTIAIIWMGIVLTYITMHELSPGNKGNPEYSWYYVGHLTLGCFTPVVYAFLTNAEFWWARYLIVPLFAAFAGFYINLAWRYELLGSYHWLAAVLLGLLSVIWLSYLLFNNNVKVFYAELKHQE